MRFLEALFSVLVPLALIVFIVMFISIGIAEILRVLYA